MNIELYIDNQLCDLPDPSQMNIVLKRVFIKPSELSTKDAQKSYDITLPPTSRNNKIFNHINIEEVQGKFNAYPDAKLYAGGVLILDGKFRLSGIDRNGYRGNLGVPAPLTAKDVFGNTTMNQAGKWETDFEALSDITKYNKGEHKKDTINNDDNPPCIFPFVLYGVMPKVETDGNYTGKTELDESVYFKSKHFPPSVNCIQMLKRIFKNTGYTLKGDALDDPRLNNLYVSYKNAEDYEMPLWTNKMAISGHWTNYKDKNIFERRFFTDSDEEHPTIPFFTANLLDADLTKVNIDFDPMKVIKQSPDKTTTDVIIQQSGLYRVTFWSKISLTKSEIMDQSYGSNLKPYRVIDGPAGLGKENVRVNFNFLKRCAEVKLLRNVDSLESIELDNKFCKNTIGQNIDDEDALFPAKAGNVNFIDPKQNPNLICGFSWGYNNNDDRGDGRENAAGLGVNLKWNWREYTNPRLGIEHHNPMAIRHGKSWDSEEIHDSPISAVKSNLYVDKNGNPDTDKYKVEMINAPETYTRVSDKYRVGEGQVSQIVWLEKGEKLSIVSVMEQTYIHRDGFHYGWLHHEVDFTLSVEPFRYEDRWLTSKMNDSGWSINTIDWKNNDESISGKIDLIRFLPADTKVNDWVDNFCKAFNLLLTDAGNNTFELNRKIKDTEKQTALIIDLDKRINVNQCENQPLDVPYVYELGFETDTAEEGYVDSLQENDDYELIVNSGYTGMGKYCTGNHDPNNKLEHKSSFSYCWYKKLDDKINSKEITVPVISDREAWKNKNDYGAVMNKQYTDKNQRFWYRDTLTEIKIENTSVEAALVTDTFQEDIYKLKLDYEDNPGSIAHNYFMLLTNDRHFTVVKCYLTPDEYRRLSESKILFNSDLYIVAEVDGYDPLGQKPATLKLIKAIS